MSRSFSDAAMTLAFSAYCSIPEIPTWKVQCEGIQRTWPDLVNKPHIVDHVGSIVCADDLDVLEATIAEWTSCKIDGSEAWKAIQTKVLHNLKPNHIGLETMVCAGETCTRDGDKVMAYNNPIEHIPGFQRPILSAGVAAVESQAIFDFFDGLFGEVSMEATWVRAIKDLGVLCMHPQRCHPDISTVKSCFKVRVTEAVNIETASLGRLKLVKACVCLEIIRHVKAPRSGLPQEPEPVNCIGSLVTEPGTLLNSRAPLIGKPNVSTQRSSVGS
jgi:hypothetical protein